MKQSIIIEVGRDELKEIIREVVRTELDDCAKQDRMISKIEAANLLQVSPRTIDRMVSRHELQPHGNGHPRYKLSEVMRWKTAF